MATISCKFCGKDVELAAGLTHCPHCNKDIEKDVLETIQVDQLIDEESDIKATGDTAKTAIAGTAQFPVSTDDAFKEVQVDKTVGSAGRTPNLADYSATLKPV